MYIYLFRYVFVSMYEVKYNSKKEKGKNVESKNIRKAKVRNRKVRSGCLATWARTPLGPD